MDFPEIKETEPIKDLKSHLISRVQELQVVLDKAQTADTKSVDNTITTNIKVYEANFGPFPDRDRYGLGSNRAELVNIKDYLH